MKKITYFLFCMISSAIWSQDEGFHATSTSVVMVKPTAHIYIDEDLKIATTASFTVESNATHSGSLMAPNSDPATGLFSYIRYVPSSNFHILSSPVVGQQINDFEANTSNDLPKDASGVLAIGQYVANSPNKAKRWFYEYKATDTAPFTSGKGYTIKRRTTGSSTFIGTLQTVGTELTYTVPEFFSPGEAFVGQTGSEDGKWGTHVWTALGNPYPSFLDATAMLDANTAIMNPMRAYLYLLDPLDPAIGFDAANNSDPTKDGNPYHIVNRTTAHSSLAPGQGFLFDPNGYNLTFKFVESAQQPQKTDADVFSRAAAVPELILHMNNKTNTKSNVGLKQTRTLFKFYSNTTKGLDVGWDAGSYSNGSFGLHSRLADGLDAFNFTIQCLPDYDYEQNIVPLAVYSSANETLNFSGDISNFPTGVSVYLEDKIENKIINLSETNYTVTPSDSQSGIGRFYLYTSSSVLDVENNATTAPFSLFKRTNNNVMIVGLDLDSKTNFVMYDVAGKQVFSTDFVVKSLKEDVAIPTLATGVYIVNVVSNQKNISKKLVIE